MRPCSGPRNRRRHDNALPFAVSSERGEGIAAVRHANLAGSTILVVEEYPLIALDLRAELEQVGAHVCLARTRDQALACIRESKVAAGVLDWRPGSDDHRMIARALKQKGVPFLFHTSHPPEDANTLRGAAVILKPERPETISFWSVAARPLSDAVRIAGGAVGGRIRRQTRRSRNPFAAARALRPRRHVARIRRCRAAGTAFC
jgi:CheY-like chemotaxis protein